MKNRTLLRFALLLVIACCADPAAAADSSAVAWWVWPIALFVTSLAIGVVAVLTGIGGGVLFVPIVGGFFPFHLDFVRGAGLLIALSGALAAAPELLRCGLASLRLAMPLALAGSVTAMVGALVGLALPAEAIQTALGATILAIAVVMWRSSKAQPVQARAADSLGAALHMHGIYFDPATQLNVEWQVRHTPAGFVAFAGIGMLAGMFGLGAGWANVPVFNLLMGVPLKLSVGSSGLLLSVVDTSAAWIYLNRGAMLPLLVAPSIVGVMLGAKVGVRLLRIAPASVVRRALIALLIVAGIRALFKGLGIWT